MSAPRPKWVSPLDARTTPERLVARVVQPGPEPRLAGFGVEDDLARHYGFLEVAALLLRGELPDPAASAALSVALTFLSPATVAEGPGHLAVLSRICDARFPATLGLCATALSEEAGLVVREHAGWLAWLAAPPDGRGPAPAPFLATDEDECTSVRRLREHVERTGLAVPELEPAPTRTAALLAILRACGLSAEAMQTAWVLARLPAVVAEAAARQPLRVREYPMNLPRVRFEVDDP